MRKSCKLKMLDFTYSDVCYQQLTAKQIMGMAGGAAHVRDNPCFWTTLTLSLVFAYLSLLAPTRMPLDYSGIISRSLPLATVWAVVIIAAVFLFRRRSVWLLLGGPIAFYWPVWLLVHGYPTCWYLGNCQ